MHAFCMGDFPALRRTNFSLFCCKIRSQEEYDREEHPARWGGPLMDIRAAAEAEQAASPELIFLRGVSGQKGVTQFVYRFICRK